MSSSESLGASLNQSQDPLDQQDYNPVVHLKQLFSVPSNLAKLKQVKDTVEQHKTALNTKLAFASKPLDSELLKREANAPAELNSLIEEFDKLKNQAETTENVITSMTLHISSLDSAKSNLIHSITILKRLQMLTTAYDQLALLVKNRQYSEMVQTLPAVQELMTYFKPYRSITQVAALSRQIGDIQVTISNQIFETFEAVIEKNQQEYASGLSSACLVLDYIGEINRTKIINWYCNSMLREYRTIFKSTDEAGSLENVSRRYAYFKRILKTHLESNSKYFAPSWQVTDELCKGFCTTTRDDIKILLSQSGRNTDVQLLLKALQETLEFEQYLEKRFVTESKKSLNNEEKSKFDKTISIAFQPHLSIWIDYQSKQLASKFAQYKMPPVPTDEEAEAEAPTVLPSSADLFIVYRQMLAQTAKLSSGTALVDLSKLFAKYLNIYSGQILKGTLPERTVSEDDIRTIALVLNTADYCFNTTTQLEEKIQSQVDKDIESQVNLENEKSSFLDIVNLCIKKFVVKIESSCEMVWREMTNTNWSKLKTVGDQSSYVSELQRNITSEASLILKHITKDLYSRMICDKIVESITSSFLTNVIRCRPISEVSSEQMLLDLYVLKSTFLSLPKLKEGAVPSQSALDKFGRHVSKSLARVETILKVILTQTDPAEGLVQNYFFLIGDKSPDNFAKILELKGLNKSAQTQFLELFKSHMTAHDNLVDESPYLQSLNISNVHNTPLPSPNPSLSTTRLDLLAKDSIEKSFERIAQNTEAPVIKLNENIKTSFGRLFRRDTSGSHSPLHK